MRAAFATLLLLSCTSERRPQSSDAPRETRLPSEWVEQQVSEARRSWTRQTAESSASIVLRVVPRADGYAHAALLDLVAQAQAALPEGHTDVERRFTTEQGLAAIWLESSFIPERTDAPYRRTHLTVVGREHIFHIMHTTREQRGTDATHAGAAALQALARTIEKEE